MAKTKPEYEVVEEFAELATALVEKYSQIFHGVEVDKVRCVKITNKERPEGKQKKHVVQAVKMPMLMDSPYGWYVTVWQHDWEELSEKHKLVLIADILNDIPQDPEDEGKIVAPDTKGHSLMFRTFKGIDYLDDPNIPHILNEEITWIKDIV